MSGIGQVLREARRSSGIQLEQAAWATRLREDYLDALERDEIDSLGLDPAIVRGTVRTYADYLGLDSAPLIAQQRAQAADAPQHGGKLRRVAITVGGVLGVVVLVAAAFTLGYASARGQLPWSSRLVGLSDRVAGGGPVADAAAEDGEDTGDRSGDDIGATGGEAVDEPAVGDTAIGDAVSGDAPGADDGSVADDGAGTGDDESAFTPPLTLELTFLGQVWVRYEVDGGDPVEGIYEPGQVETLTVDDTVALRLGVGDAVEFTLDGVAYGALASGEASPVDVVCDVDEGCRVER